MDRLIKWLVITTIACVVKGSARESKIVQTTQGPVRGYKNDDVFEFYGIPYASVPTGKNRFQAPLPGPVWMSPLDAVNDKIICYQANRLDLSQYDVREDCLVANIYMPDTNDTNLPVLLYVHGGAYEVGFGHLFGQRSLVKSKKIVAINFNYRLGIHGFLCLGTEEAPGNAGMKDQVALMRWVQKNIAGFGGNPDDVTLVGSSAGSSSVDLLMLSKMTEGLYNKVIPESGASVGPWSVQIDPVQNAKDFARANNFTNVDDIDSLEEFYKTLPFENMFSDMLFFKPDVPYLFSPCVERNIGVETFLEDTPLNILKKGLYRKVPVLYGFADMEGLLWLPLFEHLKDKMNERFSEVLPIDLQFESEDEKTKVGQIVKEFYFGDKPIGDETISGYVDYFSDIFFAYPHLISTKYQVEAGSDSIYLYLYSFYSPPILSDEAPENMLNLKGAQHCAQSMAVHDLVIDFVNDTSEEYSNMRNTLREIWINFITTGTPIPEGSHLPAWPPVGANRSPHMEIGETIQLKGSLLEQRARFWDDIYDRYYRSPVAPYHSKNFQEPLSSSLETTGMIKRTPENNACIFGGCPMETQDIPNLFKARMLYIHNLYISPGTKSRAAIISILAEIGEKWLKRKTIELILNGNMCKTL